MLKDHENLYQCTVAIDQECFTSPVWLSARLHEGLGGQGDHGQYEVGGEGDSPCLYHWYVMVHMAQY